MNIEVLISCMYQNDTSIVSRTNIRSNVLIVNQCNINEIDEKVINGKYQVRFISSQERGLSKSRNMALKNASGDVCLICDDDEILYDDYVEKIKNTFLNYPEVDIIAFQIDDAAKIYPHKEKKLNYLTVLKVASWQIAFRRESIINNNIFFDESLGSGVSNAGGEENMFLYDCLKKGLKIYFIPISIGRMIESESQWFHGFTKDFFYDRGVFTRKLMGYFGSILYGIYYLFFKYHLYKNDISIGLATKFLIKGIHGR